MRSRFLPVRGLNYHINEWGEQGAPKLFLLHGWMDCAATFDHVVSKVAQHFHVVAPDLRGFGDTDHAPGGYWFPDYFADLEVIVNHYQPYGKINLAGHSMGGNIAMMYGGIQPERVGRLLSLEALGLPPTQPADAVVKYRRWMTEVLSDQEPRVYPNRTMLMHSIHRGNPQLSPEVLEWLVDLWGKPVGDDGAMMLKGDHRHHFANPVRYSYEDSLALWQEVSAVVGLLMATQSPMYKRFSEFGRIDEARQALRVAPEHYYELDHCGHMLHLEQPEKTADILLDFFND